MVMKTAVINGLTPTATGTVNYTSSGFGTVQGAMVVVSNATSTTNPNAGASISIGVAASNGQYAIGVSAADALATSDTYRALDNTVVVRLPDFSTASFCAASLSAFITDGVTLNFSVTSSTQYRISIILIGGCTDIEVYSKSLASSGVSTVTLTMSSKPNLIFGIGNGAGSFGTSPSTIAIASFGVAHISSTDVVSQVYQGFASNDAVADEQASTLVRNNAFTCQIHADAETWYASVTGSAVGQFTIDAAASPVNDYVVGLAINTGDTDGVKLSVEDTPTTTGTKTVTAPGWQPQSVILGVTGHPTTNTINNADPVAWGIGGYDGTNQFCHAIDVDDAAATIDTQSNSSTTQGLQLYNGSGGHALLVEGAFTGMTSTGYTMNFTTVDGTVRKFLSIAIKAASGAVTRTINGSCTTNLTSNATLLRNLNRSFNGATQTNLTSAATLLKNQNKIITGDTQITFTSAASLLKNQNKAISGNGQLFLTSSASLLKNQNKTLSGSVQTNLTSNATLVKNKNVTLTASGGFNILANALLDKSGQKTINGSSITNITSSASLLKNQNKTVSGSSSVLIQANALLAKNKNVVISGTTTVTVASNASMQAQAGKVILGNTQIVVLSNAVMSHNLHRTFTADGRIAISSNGVLIYTGADSYPILQQLLMDGLIITEISMDGAIVTEINLEGII